MIYLKMAIRNIRAHPLQFLENCLSNVGRMLFNFQLLMKHKNKNFTQAACQWNYYRIDAFAWFQHV